MNQIWKFLSPWMLNCGGEKVFPYLRRKRLFVCLFVLHQMKLQNRRDLVFNFGFWGISILGLQPASRERPSQWALHEGKAAKHGCYSPTFTPLAQIWLSLSPSKFPCSSLSYIPKWQFNFSVHRPYVWIDRILSICSCTFWSKSEKIPRFRKESSLCEWRVKEK